MTFTLISYQRCGSDLVGGKEDFGDEKNQNLRIADIDTEDAHNELVVIDQVAQRFTDLLRYCNESRIFDYMKLQAEINEEKRSNLID
ncbi:hypothetical protein RJ641_033607 [Dillenia turbinata]|uniref:Uncharacterized protein n=1 Tax=Dillenia turbinata TaxID=194707 RepID=A0AAN8VVK2_9MAGN